MAAVVAAVLGGTLLVIRRVAEPAAEAGLAAALGAAGSAIEDALAARSQTLRQKSAVLALVPDYRSRTLEAIRTGDSPNLLDQADEFRAQIGADWVLITDAEGVLRAWTLRPERTGLDLAGGALIGMALENAEPTQGMWTEPDDYSTSLYQAVGIPLADAQGPPAGVLVAALKVDSALAAGLRRNTGSEVVFYVLDSAGRAAPLAGTISGPEVNAALTSLPALEDADSASGGVPVRVGDDWLGVRGVLRTASGTPVAGYLGLRSRQAAIAPFQRLQQAVTLAFPIGLLLALLASLLVARQVTGPVLALVGLTRKVAEGDLTATLPRTSKDEVGELARAFGRMVEELREKQRLVELLGGIGHITGQVSESPPSSGTLPAAVGTVLAGRYELVSVLGTGGMGQVYRARDRELGETVALKTLHGDVGSYSPDMLERFKREIRAARRITHRNVVRTHDLGEDRGLYFITMEYAEGTGLDHLIRKRGKLPPDAVVAIGKQLCRALAAAHEAGVIHRDIKPGNMVVQADGVLKVMDFGIARLAGDTPPGGAELTQVGVVIGTPSYMPPEQLMGEELDSRTDLYSAGAVLFESLTGQKVRTGNAMIGMLAVSMNKAAPDPREFVPEIPEPLARIIRKALENDRTLRFQSADEMNRALEELTPA